MDSPSYIIGRLIRAHCRAEGDHPVEQPLVGALVVEATHAWRVRSAWPEDAAVGYVEKVEPEGEYTWNRTATRVTIRRLDDGTLQPWVNAEFFVCPPL